MGSSRVEPKATPARAPDKLDPVGILVRKTFPGRPYLVLVWTEDRKGKPMIEMITNCEIQEAAARMRACVDEFDQAKHVRELIRRLGHACLTSGLSFALLEAVLEPDLFDHLLGWLWVPLSLAEMI